MTSYQNCSREFPNRDVTRTGLTLPKAKHDWARPSNHERTFTKQYAFVQNNSAGTQTIDLH